MITIIRQWHENDLANLVLHANNIHIWNKLRNYFPHPYTELDGKAWIAHSATTPVTNFAIDVNGEAVGGVGIFQNKDVYYLSAEVGYWVAEPYWGKGIATEAVKQITAYTFKNFDIIRLYAEVFENNKPSMKVLEKNGFSLETIRKKAVIKNNVVMDDYVWVKFKPDF